MYYISISPSDGDVIYAYKISSINLEDSNFDTPSHFGLMPDSESFLFAGSYSYFNKEYNRKVLFKVQLGEDLQSGELSYTCTDRSSVYAKEQQ